MCSLAIRAYLFVALVLTATVRETNAADMNGSGDCFGSLRNALAVGGYTGGLDCNSVNVKIIKVGTLHVSSKSYTVYDLRYRTVPIMGGSPHGGQRILFLLNDKIYLGQYSLNTPPMHDLRIKGSSIYMLDVPSEHGNKISIGKNGPPKNIYIDQDNKDLFK